MKNTHSKYLHLKYIALAYAYVHQEMRKWMSYELADVQRNYLWSDSAIRFDLSVL